MHSCFLQSILEYRFIFDLAVPLYMLSLFLLILVLFVGDEVNNHSSWFNIFGFKFQPSEFSKFSTALFLAKTFDSYTIDLKKPKHLILTSFIILLPSAIILFQGDTGTASLLFFFFSFFKRGFISKLFAFVFCFCFNFCSRIAI